MKNQFAIYIRIGREETEQKVSARDIQDTVRREALPFKTAGKFLYCNENRLFPLGPLEEDIFEDVKGIGKNITLRLLTGTEKDRGYQYPQCGRKRRGLFH